MNKEKRITQIDSELERLSDIIEVKNSKYDFTKSVSFQHWEDYLQPETNMFAKLDRERRLLLEPKFSEIPDYGDVMSLESFIENVNDGGFIDYDGSGNYARDNKMSDISIHPSDVESGSIRTDFDTVVWFNR